MLYNDIRTHTDTHTYFEYICKSYHSYTPTRCDSTRRYAKHYQTWNMKHQWKCQARNKHSNKDNSKDKQFPRFQMFSPLGAISTHVLCTNFIMHTKLTHTCKHRRTAHAHRQTHTKCSHMSLCRHFMPEFVLHCITRVRNKMVHFISKSAKFFYFIYTSEVHVQID